MRKFFAASFKHNEIGGNIKLARYNGKWMFTVSRSSKVKRLEMHWNCAHTNANETMSTHEWTVQRYYTEKHWIVDIIKLDVGKLIMSRVQQQFKHWKPMRKQLNTETSKHRIIKLFISITGLKSLLHWSSTTRGFPFYIYVAFNLPRDPNP